tara:strand:+ start:858 stop:1583 length:726 start_codon:yes stop_codon:yes gene_type:complete
MEELDYWRLCEELNIVQAAFLVVGEAPTQAEYVEQWDIETRPTGYEAAKTAICGALKNYVLYKKELAEFESQSDYLREEYRHAPDMVLENEDNLTALYRRSIEGNLVPKPDFDMNGNHIGYLEGTIDLYASTINVESLRQWLALKGFSTGFFFPVPVTTLDFLDPLNSRYAPKLAAAVKAWQAVTDPGRKSPKQALDKWLREHAAEYGLTNDEGKPIETAIEECSKVANWNQTGGAPKTPT